MMGIIYILKNNFKRAWSRKNETIVFMAVTFTSMILAIAFSTMTISKLNVAVVSDSDELQFDSPHLNIEVMKKVPPKSDLIMNKYCGVLLDRGDGDMEVLVAKNAIYRAELEQFTTNPQNSSTQDDGRRGVGTNREGCLIGAIVLRVLSETNFR